MLNPKSKNAQILICAFFILTELSLYVAIQASSGFFERLVCFFSVVCAALFALLHLNKKKESILTVLALGFTVCADVFLVLLAEQQRLLAMCFFSLVQICYFVRILLENTNKATRTRHLSTRAFALVLALVLTLSVLGDGADALSVVSMLYFANLIVNIVFAFVGFKKTPLLAIGLLSFAMCDVLVGLSLIDMYISIAEDSFIYKITHTGFNLIWTFYVPSQTLIALSAAKLKYRETT